VQHGRKDCGEPEQDKSFFITGKRKIGCFRQLQLLA
jgi:hypothetical protein